jgi:hypothetical protein
MAPVTSSSGRLPRERESPAHAEAHGEDLAYPVLHQALAGGAGIGHQLLVLRLGDVRLVIEALAAIVGRRRTAEVVDRDRVDAAFGEPQRELLVEVVQAADVREDHYACARWRLGLGVERHELRAIG